MKTKQEQIEKLAQLIGRIKDDCENCDCKSCEVNGEDCCCVHYICATFLVDAGYGEVSEYKAEIEDLKDEIIYLERKIAIRDNALKDRDKAIEMLEGKQDTIVKQAKIDMLNEAKKCSCCDNFFPDGQWHRFVFVSDIDILIKRVENDK